MGKYQILPKTNTIREGLTADFSGLENLETIVSKVLRRLEATDRVQQQARMVHGGQMTLQDFDGWFSELVRAELGKTLGIIRNKAVQKAQAAGAGSAASAVLRKMYRKEYMGNINILGSKKRISSKVRYDKRQVGGKSGIVRERTERKRTRTINEYYGPDRHFILRFMNTGTDVRVATPEGPTGKRSKATYGNRGSITQKGFFHSMSSDMEQAARQLGQTLINHVEKWVEQEFKEE